MDNCNSKEELLPKDLVSYELGRTMLAEILAILSFLHLKELTEKSRAKEQAVKIWKEEILNIKERKKSELEQELSNLVKKIYVSRIALGVVQEKQDKFQEIQKTLKNKVEEDRIADIDELSFYLSGDLMEKIENEANNKTKRESIPVKSFMIPLFVYLKAAPSIQEEQKASQLPWWHFWGHRQNAQPTYEELPRSDSQEQRRIQKKVQ